MTCDYELVEGFEGVITITAYKADGTIYDLAGLTPHLSWVDAQDVAQDRVMSVISPSSDGVASYTFSVDEIHASSMFFDFYLVDGFSTATPSTCGISVPVRKPTAPAP